jgi:hypothetical protein
MSDDFDAIEEIAELGTTARSHRSAKLTRSGIKNFKRNSPNGLRVPKWKRQLRVINGWREKKALEEMK